MAHRIGMIIPVAFFQGALCREIIVKNTARKAIYAKPQGANCESAKLVIPAEGQATLPADYPAGVKYWFYPEDCKEGLDEKSCPKTCNLDCLGCYYLTAIPAGTDVMVGGFGYGHNTVPEYHDGIFFANWRGTDQTGATVTGHCEASDGVKGSCDTSIHQWKSLTVDFGDYDSIGDTPNGLECEACEKAANLVIGKGAAECAVGCAAAAAGLGPLAPVIGAACGEICHLIEGEICDQVASGNCAEKICQEVKLCSSSQLTNRTVSSIVV